MSVHTVGPDHVVGLGVFGTLFLNDGLGLISALYREYSGDKVRLPNAYISGDALSRDVELLCHTLL